MDKKWLIAKNITKEFRNKFPEIHPIILQLLYNRNLKTQEQIDEFLNPDYSQDIHNPFLFSEMEKTVERIFKAILNKEKILVYGDYDADGISAAVILIELFKELGVEVDVYLPDRGKEGYGLNEKAMRNFSKKGIDLIITVDCAINDNKEISLAKDLGIDIIVTDHHCEPLELSKDAYAIINPKIRKEKYPFRGLSGVGVAFKLVQAIIQRQKSGLGKQLIKEGWEKWLLDLVAIGTVADLMPLLGENRTLVKYGLVVLNKTQRIGLKALLKETSIENKNLDTWSIGFQIGPRLNAAGRINHANLSLKLLLSKSPQEAEKIAKELNQTNQTRQKMVEDLIGEVEKKLGQIDKKSKVIFVLGENWPKGIIGLIANRLMNKWYRPCLVMTEKDGEIVGSGRSVSGIDIMQFLQELGDYFTNYGGHPQACGFTLKDKKLVNKFQEEFTDLIEKELKDKELLPEVLIEKEMKLEEVNWEFYEELEKFEPFGRNNIAPLFLIKNLKLVGLQKVGNNGTHLKIMVQDEKSNIKKTIGFGIGNHWGEKLKIGARIDGIFELSVNQWNGTRELQMKIIDLKIADTNLRIE